MKTNAFAESSLDELAQKTGNLKEFAIEASKGNIDFSYIFMYLKELFFNEFINMKNCFFILFSIVMTASLIECITFEDGISTAVKISVAAACIIASSDTVSNLFVSAGEVIENLHDFMMFSFPYYCSLLATSGKTLSAAKGALISLGSANILSALIQKVFFPFAYLFYIMVVSSALIENDIFKSFKKTLVSCQKIILPSIVGLYTTVLTLFVKTSQKNDEFLLKATKTALSSSVPFLGNILNNSADTVLSSVSLIQSQAGILGTAALLFILISPLVKLIAGMLMFKLLGIISCFTGNEKLSAYFGELSEAVGIITGMVGTMAVIVLISIMLMI